MKTCNVCKKELDDLNFYRSCPTRCKICYNQKVSKRAKESGYWLKRYHVIKHTPAYLARVKRKLFKKRLKKFNITKNWFSETLKKQNGLCEICGTKKDASLCIDHNHSSNQVRGLLCYHCNLMLGHAFENIAILQNGIAYLEKYKEAGIIIPAPSSRFATVN